MMNDLKMKQKAMTNAQLSPDVDIKPFYKLLVSYGVKPNFLKSFNPIGDSLPPEYIKSVQEETDILQAGINRIDINISLLAMIIKELKYQYSIYDKAAKEYKVLNKELKKIKAVKQIIESYNTNPLNITGFSIYHRIDQSILDKNKKSNENTFQEGKLTIREQALTDYIFNLLRNNVNQLEKNI
ncbi:MAG: hypothetical protein M0D57_13670 [Sphingobacteriales bacterium JAD_PAG50586_3]|nr:MAG: hypothetical protein M0D57_13670 [Sphingobacteriales bacterium JAD_PAG50586_3]